MSWSPVSQMHRRGHRIGASGAEVISEPKPELSMADGHQMIVPSVLIREIRKLMQDEWPLLGVTGNPNLY
ncbi:hypothetical protein ZWY2020_017752 [Hordeum vulgare]|nr:hypothetical protein ZWY2020_017752 [Hordeum vulgare]